MVKGLEVCPVTPLPSLARACLRFNGVIGPSRKPRRHRGSLMTVVYFIIHLLSVFGAVPCARCWGAGNKAIRLTLKEHEISHSHVHTHKHRHIPLSHLPVFSLQALSGH